MASASSSMQSNTEPEPLLEQGRYVKMQTLGKGSFGLVLLAHDTATGEQVAIKCLARGGLSKYVERELLIHRLLRHPHVVQFKEVFLTSEYLCIVMEYASGGTLFAFVQRAVRLKEVVARWFFQQLAVGVDYCHRRGVVNRDIKLENTLLDYVPGLPLPLIKICDFGYSKADFMSDPKSRVGTPVYMAPEVILSHFGTYDGKLADIWSCGVMLYVMLVGQYPFDSESWRKVARVTGAPGKAREVMSTIRLNVPPDVEISPECLDLLTRILTADPARRCSMEQIMAHPWFLTNLPVEAASMNQQYLEEAPCALGSQSTEQIKAIVTGAMISQGHKALTTQESYDLAIDDEIDNNLAHDNPSLVFDGPMKGRAGMPLQQ